MTVRAPRSRPGLVVATLLAAAFALSACGGSPVAEEPPPARPVATQAPSPAPSPIPTGVALPSVLYEQASNAKVDLSALKQHLVVKVVSSTTMRYAPDTVMAQSPKSGTVVAPGSTVTLTVSTPPKCDPSYPTLCLKPFSHTKCSRLHKWNFPVKPPDPEHLDANGDGIGCGHGDSRPKHKKSA